MKKLILLALSITWFMGSAQSFKWSAQTSGITTSLTDVFFIDSQTGWAVGDNGVIINTTDGGTTWSSQASGTTKDMTAVFFIDANTGWAVGYDLDNIILKTTDGGNVWADITMGAASTGILRDIAFANSNKGWMVSSDSIYTSSDGGTTWINQSVNSSVTSQGYRAVTVPTDSTAYVGGQSKRLAPTNTYADVFSKSVSTSSAFDFISSDQSNFKTSDGYIYCIDFATPNVLFAGGAEGTIYKIDFKGTINYSPWRLNLDLMPTTSSQVIQSIAFPNASNGMFLTNGTSSTTNALIYHTADTGSTWNMTPDTIAGLLPNALHAADASTAWVVGRNGEIFKGEQSFIGINELGFNLQTKIFPNPTRGLTTVEITSNTLGVIRYSLLDIAGRQVLKESWTKRERNARFELNMKNLTSGVYILNIIAPNGENTVLRILKN
jgi:photosystem II stability/assembly factor-like uncharacterized protein